MERGWRLGIDLYPEDNLLDSITFKEIITTICCNEKVINRESARRCDKEILDMRMNDFKDLLEINLDEIVEAALSQRNEG